MNFEDFSLEEEKPKEEREYRLGRYSKEEIREKVEEFDNKVISEETKEAPKEIRTDLELMDRLGITEEMLVKSGDLLKKEIRNNKGKIVGYNNKTSLAQSFYNGVKRGRPSNKKKTPDELSLSAFLYFKKIDLTEEKPTLVGLCNDLGISVRTFKRYKTYPEYEDIIDRMWNTLKIPLVQGNAVQDIFELKNTYDYKDKVEQSITVENPLDKMGDDEIDDMIKLTETEEGTFE